MAVDDFDIADAARTRRFQRGSDSAQPTMYSEASSAVLGPIPAKHLARVFFLIPMVPAGQRTRLLNYMIAQRGGAGNAVTFV